MWLAPEVLAGQEYAEAADIYSVAMVMWELAARTDFLHEVPFWAAKEQHVIAGGRSEIPEDTPSVMRELIKRCWDNDPMRRPPMAYVAQALIGAIPPETTCVVTAAIVPFIGQQPAAPVGDSTPDRKESEGSSSYVYRTNYRTYNVLSKPTTLLANCSLRSQQCQYEFARGGLPAANECVARPAGGDAGVAASQGCGVDGASAAS